MDALICSVCGSKNLKQIEIRDDLRYVACRDCAHCVKLPNSGSTHADFLANQAAYYDESSIDPFGEPALFQAERMAVRKAVSKRHLRTGDRLMEVGPGRGTFLEWARDEGYSCTACEQAPFLAKSLRALGFEVIEDEFEQIQLEPVFNAVCSFHIIEHVDDPLKHLSKAYELTRAGGHLLIATPNASSWQQRLLPTLSPNFDYAHLHVFSRKSLEILASSAGWKLVEQHSYEYAPSWLRFFTKAWRRVRGEDEARTAGKYSNAIAANSRAEAALRLFSAITAPFRRTQAALGGGNEIFFTFRKPGA